MSINRCQWFDWFDAANYWVFFSRSDFFFFGPSIESSKRRTQYNNLMVYVCVCVCGERMSQRWLAVARERARIDWALRWSWHEFVRIVGCICCANINKVASASHFQWAVDNVHRALSPTTIEVLINRGQTDTACAALALSPSYGCLPLPMIIITYHTHRRALYTRPLSTGRHSDDI